VEEELNIVQVAERRLKTGIRVRGIVFVASSALYLQVILNFLAVLGQKVCHLSGDGRMDITFASIRLFSIFRKSVLHK